MPELEHELRILEEIERNPDVTQASLAVQLGVAVGSVNWYVRRLITKGYVKVTHLQRRKLRYFLTPSGIALKIDLTRSYMEVSLRVYRDLRREAREILAEVRRRGFTAVCIEESPDEALEILRLTCLEHGTTITKPDTCLAGGFPCVSADGAGFRVTWPMGEQEGSLDGRER